MLGFSEGLPGSDWPVRGAETFQFSPRKSSSGVNFPTFVFFFLCETRRSSISNQRLCDFSASSTDLHASLVADHLHTYVDRFIDSACFSESRFRTSSLITISIILESSYFFDIRPPRDRVSFLASRFSRWNIRSLIPLVRFLTLRFRYRAPSSLVSRG